MLPFRIVYGERIVNRKIVFALVQISIEIGTTNGIVSAHTFCEHSSLVIS